MRHFTLLLLLGLVLPARANSVFPLLETNVLPPVIQCPPNTTVGADTFACTAAFSYSVVASDDQPGWILTQTAGLPSGANFPAGTTLNIFQVSNDGDTATCSFTVSVIYNMPAIRFPDDLYLAPCDSAEYYGEPVIFGGGNQMTVTYEDQYWDAFDACIRIERNWTILNWCTYNPALPLVMVPNPNPKPSFNHPENLLGPIVSAPGTPAPWASTFVKINPNQPMATDYSFFYAPDANGYVYKQSIKLIDLVSPVATDCPAGPLFFADSTQNDDLLWNAVFNPALPAQDMPETPLDLHITAYDACSGSSVGINYTLFLDLDADGVQETVVRPNVSAPNIIYYNNAGSANYTGGAPTAFDLRPVPANQKYSFGLETVINGSSRTATVRWSTGQFSGPPYVPVQLPAGIHRIKWLIEDGCGNPATCAYDFVVKGGPPVVHCPSNTTVAADISACTTTFNYTVLDSDDQPGVNPLQTAGLPSGATFPAGTTLNTFQITSAGDTASCSFTVHVVDNLPPAVDCSILNDTTVDCENFDPTLSAYGQANFSDNCCLGNIISSVNYSGFDTVCNRGTITRTFLAFDCSGNSSGCSQQVMVVPSHGYFVRFPDDVFSTACDGTNFFGEPVFLSGNCEHVSISYENLIIEVVPDACFRIDRQWTVVDGCMYNPALPFVIVPNPNPNPISNHPLNLPGPVVSAPGTPAPWASTIVKINPTDPIATDYSSFYDAGANGYVYIQRIKIIDNQEPVVADCPAVPLFFADSSQNDAQLWSNVFNPALPAQNLSETPADLQITATDTCYGANLTFRYLLYLDLNSDGALESVVNSANLPPAGTVFYGNTGGPGIPVSFDQRPVPANEKYRFALQTIVDGSNKIAAIRWNTPQSPGTFVVPQLPYGPHSIKWFIEDGCGNQTSCDYGFMVEGDVVVPVHEPESVSGSGFALYQNAPNPFRGSTAIGFNLPEPATASLSVFDAHGSLLFRHSAAYDQGFNTIDLDGSTLDADGILYYKLETDKYTAWRKMALIRL